VPLHFRSPAAVHTCRPGCSRAPTRIMARNADYVLNPNSIFMTLVRSCPTWPKPVSEQEQYNELAYYTLAHPDARRVPPDSRKNSLPFPLLADHSGAVAKTYGSTNRRRRVRSPLQNFTFATPARKRRLLASAHGHIAGDGTRFVALPLGKAQTRMGRTVGIRRPGRRFEPAGGWASRPSPPSNSVPATVTPAGAELVRGGGPGPPPLAFSGLGGIPPDVWKRLGPKKEFRVVEKEFKMVDQSKSSNPDQASSNRRSRRGAFLIALVAVALLAGATGNLLSMAFGQGDSWHHISWHGGGFFGGPPSPAQIDDRIDRMTVADLRPLHEKAHATRAQAVTLLTAPHHRS
jgi:hypothetical protein